MTERKPFLLRLDPGTMAALRTWAADDLRSLNGEIEFLLRRALRDAGRLPASMQRGEALGPVIDDGDVAPGNAMNGGAAAVVLATRTRGERQ